MRDGQICNGNWRNDNADTVPAYAPLDTYSTAI